MKLNYEQIETTGELIRYSVTADELDSRVIVGVEHRRLDGLTPSEAQAVIEAGVERVVAKELRSFDVPDVPDSGAFETEGRPDPNRRPPIG